MRMHLVRIAALLLPATLGAQVMRVHPPMLGDPAVRACIERLPDAEFATTIVSLSVTARTQEHAAAQDAANLLAQDVGARVRVLLGALEGRVPDASAKLPWTSVWGTARFGLWSDGAVRMLDFPMRDAADSLARDGSALLRQALDSLRAEGERWPYQQPGVDEVEFTLFFSFVDRVEAPTGRSPLRIVSVPVFTHRLPLYRPTMWVVPPPSGSLPRYPDRMRNARVTAQVDVGFDLDAAGRPVRESFAELSAWHEDRAIDGLTITGQSIVIDGPRLSVAGPLATPRTAEAAERQDFVASIRKALPRMRFRRGRIGTCELAGRVEVRIAYTLQP